MLIGNMTRDPELRYTPQGTAVCTFGLATNRQWTPADGGERQEEVEFHRIVAWAKLAEICAQILYKGRKTYCEGRLQTRTWTGQDGQERTTTEVVIDTMIALGPPKPGAGEAGNEYSAAAQGVSTADPQVTSEEVTEELIPEEVGEEIKEPRKKKAVAGKKKSTAKKAKDKEVTEEAEDVSEDDIPF